MAEGGGRPPRILFKVLFGIGMALTTFLLAEWYVEERFRASDLHGPFLVAWASSELLKRRWPALSRMLEGVAFGLLVAAVGAFLAAVIGSLVRGEYVSWIDRGLLGLLVVAAVVVPTTALLRWWRRRADRGPAPTA